MNKIQIDLLTRTKRKTLHLEVGSDARLTVRVPLHCSDEITQKFVDEHRDWIMRKQSYAKEHYKQVIPQKYLPGEKFLYLGKEYKLITLETTRGSLAFKGANFIINAAEIKDAPELFYCWYKKEAQKIIYKRTKLFSSITGIKYQKVQITNAHHRWGSCNRRGNLNFTARLIKAPLEIIDCVVVHELVHMEIRGHRNGFWERVNTFIPDLESRRAWLNENQNLLAL